MNHQDQIEKHGYCVFDLTKAKDKDAITPISAKYQTSTLPLIDKIQSIYMGEDTKPEAEIRILHFDV